MQKPDQHQGKVGLDYYLSEGLKKDFDRVYKGIEENIDDVFFKRVRLFPAEAMNISLSSAINSLDIVVPKMVETLVYALTMPGYAVGGDIIKLISESEMINPVTRKEIEQWSKNPTLWNTILAIFIGGISAIQSARNWMSVIGIIETQDAMKAYKPMIPEIQYLVANLFRHPENEIKLKDLLAKNGFNPEMVKLMEQASKPLLDVPEISALYLRGILSLEDYSNRLGRMGYNTDDIDMKERLTRFIPQAQDLIRFSVREVFNPTAVAEMQMDTDFPQEFANWFSKVGGTEYWAKAFWRSHWILPSVGHGFNMLHRKEIDENQLRKLLQYSDIMPSWIQPLINISYNPLTRVDVRRMYRVGVFKTRAELIDRYMDLGYNRDNAELMTDFTIEYETKEEKNLSKSEILKGFKKGFFSWSETISYLVEIGYGKETAEYYAAMADLEQVRKDKDLTQATIKKMLMSGVMSFDNASDKLLKMGYDTKESGLLIEQWKMEREGNITLLPEKVLDKAYKGNIITNNELIEQLTKRNYCHDDISIYVQVLDMEKK